MLPWFDASERTTLRRNAIERGLRTRHPDADEARIAALRDAAMAQTSASPGGADTDRGTLRHEIGHLLLIEAFWTDRSRDGPVSHYGGPGPDWLDETAGVLMETDAMADGRRHLLYGDEAPSRLRPLDEFFAMPHPMIAGILAARAQTLDAPSGGIRVLSGDTGRRVAGDAHWFYVQARGVADYLLARSGTPSVFAGIAAAAAAGDGFVTWLATRQGPRPARIDGRAGTRLAGLAGGDAALTPGRARAAC